MKKGLPKVIALSIAFAMLFMASGCTPSNQSGGTIDEPEITTGYLESEYKAQLLRDGAQELFGSPEVYINDEGMKCVIIHEKEFVKSDNYPNGFYIADKNISEEAFLSDEARITFLPGGASSAEVLTPNDFLSAYNNEENMHQDDSKEYYDTKVYHFYMFDDQVLLMLAQYIP